MSRSWIALVIAGVMLVMLANTASAQRLSVTNRNFRIVWAPLNLRPEPAGGLLVQCKVTMEGSFHSNTIAKVAESLIGYVTRATVASSCEAARMWIYNGTDINEVLGAGVLPNSLPWHVRYESFEGTLPRPTGVRIRLIGMRVLLQSAGILCQYTSSAAQPSKSTALVNSEQQLTRLRVDKTAQIPRTEGGIFCPATGVAEGEGEITLLGNAFRIRLTLI